MQEIESQEVCYSRSAAGSNFIVHLEIKKDKSVGHFELQELHYAAQPGKVAVSEILKILGSGTETEMQSLLANRGIALEAEGYAGCGCEKIGSFGILTR